MLLYGLVQIFLQEFLYGAVQFFLTADLFLVGDVFFLVEKGFQIIAVIMDLVNINDANVLDFDSFAMVVFVKPEREDPMGSFLVMYAYLVVHCFSISLSQLLRGQGEISKHLISSRLKHVPLPHSSFGSS